MQNDEIGEKCKEVWNVYGKRSITKWWIQVERAFNFLLNQIHEIYYKCNKICSKLKAKEYDYNEKLIQAFHNETLIRSGKTNEMIWNPEKIIVWLSSWMTLYPGDIISTGAPVRTRSRLYLKNGDSFTVKIEGFPDLKTSFYDW